MDVSKRARPGRGGAAGAGKRWHCITWPTGPGSFSFQKGGGGGGVWYLYAPPPPCPACCCSCSFAVLSLDCLVPFGTTTTGSVAQQRGPWSTTTSSETNRSAMWWVRSALTACPATRHLLFSPVGIWTDVGLLLGRRRGMRQLWCVRADLFFMPCNLGGGLVQGDQEMRVASTFCVDGERGMGLAPRYRGLHARGASA